MSRLRKFQRRPYQERAVRSLFRLLRAHVRVLAVAPPGAGKTLIGARVAVRFRRVLWLVHSWELIQQAYATLARYVPESKIGVLSAKDAHVSGGDDRIRPHAPIQIVSVAMLRTRDLPECDLIVIDEAHRAAAESYQTILASKLLTPVLGLTATPVRLDGKPLNFFAHLEEVATVPELLVGGYVSNPVVWGIPASKARELVAGVRKSNKDFAPGELGRAIRRRLKNVEVIAEFKRLVGEAQAIYYAVDRKHAKSLLRAFLRAGIQAEYVDGETPDLRRLAILDGMRSGATQVLVNVDVATEGLDVPTVRVVGLCRPTESLGRFIQQCGRAMRAKSSMVIDHVGNGHRHGLPSDSREWALAGRTKGSGPTPMALCSRGHLVHSGFNKCPICGLPMPRDARDIHDHQLELERMRSIEQETTRRRAVLIEIAKSRRFNKKWVESALAALDA